MSVFLSNDDSDGDSMTSAVAHWVPSEANPGMAITNNASTVELLSLIGDPLFGRTTS